MHNISDIQLISFPLFETKEAFLIVYESGKQIPFTVQRLFVIKSTEKCNRGFHAHKECSQILVVLNGECKITCNDGISKKTVLLNKASEGLLIPPAIWAEQEYQPDTTLMVLTDKPYDENDYLRDYTKFLEFRKKP